MGPRNPGDARSVRVFVTKRRSKLGEDAASPIHRFNGRGVTGLDRPPAARIVIETFRVGRFSYALRARSLRIAGGLPMDAAAVPCELVRMDVERSRLPDEVHGARAAGSIVVGDLAEAEAELAGVRTGYLAGFLMRLALLIPSVSVRLAWRVAIRRSGGRRRGTRRGRGKVSSRPRAPRRLEPSPPRLTSGAEDPTLRDPRTRAMRLAPFWVRRT